MNRHLINQFPYTSVALTLAIAVTVLARFWSIDVFELPGIDIIAIERSEVGEVVIAFLLVIPAWFVDRVVARQRAHEAQIQAEQLRVLRATMRTVQDIVNNNLNELQLLRLDAEGHVPQASLDVFDEVIQETSAKLKAIAELDAFTEKQLETGEGLDDRPARRGTGL